MWSSIWFFVPKETDPMFTALSLFTEPRGGRMIECSVETSLFGSVWYIVSFFKVLKLLEHHHLIVCHFWEVIPFLVWVVSQRALGSVSTVYCTRKPNKSCGHLVLSINCRWVADCKGLKLKWTIHSGDSPEADGVLSWYIIAIELILPFISFSFTTMRLNIYFIFCVINTKVLVTTICIKVDFCSLTSTKHGTRLFKQMNFIIIIRI